jgi:hypothetical protein
MSIPVEWLKTEIEQTIKTMKAEGRVINATTVADHLAASGGYYVNAQGNRCPYHRALKRVRRVAVEVVAAMNKTPASSRTETPASGFSQDDLLWRRR